MPGGAYSALSGMRTRLDELDRLAADLANVNTVGYKTERAANYASVRNDEFANALESAVDVALGTRKIDFKPGLIAATGQRREAVTVAGAAAAAARVAENAMLDRSVTMRSANCDQYTWVRVEGAQQVSDLLIPAMQEEPCQAARIAR